MIKIIEKDTLDKYSKRNETHTYHIHTNKQENLRLTKSQLYLHCSEGAHLTLNQIRNMCCAHH